MGRQIVTAEDVQRFRATRVSPGGMAGGLAGGVAAAPALSPEKEPKLDTYQERLLKYIPAEIVTLYVFLDGVLRVAPSNVPATALRWSSFLRCWWEPGFISSASKKCRSGSS
jgi:hypothetical protein